MWRFVPCVVTTLVATLALAGISAMVARYFTIDTWFELLGACIALTIPYALAAWRLGLRPSERAEILSIALKRPSPKTDS